MGSAQSQEEQPDVVRIDRDEIPEEYKTVGVSSDVVKRVNAQTGGGSTEAERLKDELAHERLEKERLKREMSYLTELQARQPSDVTGHHCIGDDIEERKRVFNETVERVEKKFFSYQRENVCADHEKEIMECIKANPNRVLNCGHLLAPYEKCVSDFRDEVLKGK
ncbi:hypothetical protein V3C99_013129 [Haemonchus contortus]